MPHARDDLPEVATRTQEIETQLTAGTPAESAARPAQVPGLTILSHPDRSRVGDRLALPVLAAGRAVRLSRLEPVFAPPAGGASLPLRESHLSRQPIRLIGDGQGGVRLDLRSTRTPVAVDGVEVEDEGDCTAAEIERGVVLVLGHRVVLLLHSMAIQPLASPEVDGQGAKTGLVGETGLIGESAAMVRLRQEIERTADLEVPVILRGETGTGKELVARAVHAAGPRRERPFVAVNMGALPPTLAAAELFGAARGAFTGASRSKTGLFQKADGGTLFLDEIGETPPEVQVLLLRTLETREVLPVGSVDPRPVDVRVLAATDADLESAIAAGRFRAPLYHRLAGYSIRLPALRERRDDLGRLFFHFLEREQAALGSRAAKSPRPWPPADLVARLAREDWPGNVRQLRNVTRRLVIAGSESGLGAGSPELDELLREGSATAVAPQDPPVSAVPVPAVPMIESLREGEAPAVERLPKEQRQVGKHPPTTVYRSPKEVDDDELLEALRANGWRLKPTAAQLHVSRTSLYALIDRCPRIRRATDLGREELATCFERYKGRLERMADALEVSPQGLRHRLQELGLGGSASS